MSQPESRIVKRIQAYLEDKGARPFKIHGDGDFQEVGIPDLLVCYKGQFVGLEVKLPGEKPSKRQELVMSSITGAGGVAEVVTSVEQVASLLASLDKRRWREGTRARTSSRVKRKS